MKSKHDNEDGLETFEEVDEVVEDISEEEETTTETDIQIVPAEEVCYKISLFLYSPLISSHFSMC